MVKSEELFEPVSFKKLVFLKYASMNSEEPPQNVYFRPLVLILPGLWVFFFPKLVLL